MNEDSSVYKQFVSYIKLEYIIVMYITMSHNMMHINDVQSYLLNNTTHYHYTYILFLFLSFTQIHHADLASVSGLYILR